MLRNDFKDFVKVNEVLEEIVDKYGWKDRLFLAKIINFWQEISVGIPAAHVRIWKFEGGQLFMSVKSAAWRNEIFLRKDEIVKKINEKIGQNAVNELIIR